MPETTDLGPLTVTHDGSHYRFTLTSPATMTLEVPPDYDWQLNKFLSEAFAADEAANVMLDMEELPAISSRQLGLMIELHKAARSRHQTLPVTGIGAGVRELLEKTNMEQFFEIV